ncbi:MAG: sterol desaturase family protein [Planctomycetota bacterium]
MGRLLLGAWLLSSLWWMETFFIGDHHRKQRIQHGIANLTMATLNAAMLYGTVGILTLALASWCARHQVGILRHEWLTTSENCPWWVGWVIAMLLLDLLSYAWHRANHALPWLWRFHQVHHSDEAMDVTSAARFHIGELFLAAFMRAPFIVVIGLEPLMVVAYESILVSVSLFHHSRLRLGAIEPWLRWWVVTPEMHDIHHRREADDFNHNFASVLPIWDRIAGTHRRIALSSDARTGIAGLDSTSSSTVRGMLTMTFWPRAPFESVGVAFRSGSLIERRRRSEVRASYSPLFGDEPDDVQ